MCPCLLNRGGASSDPLWPRLRSADFPPLLTHGTFQTKASFASCNRDYPDDVSKWEREMNGLIYLIGLIVVVMVILSFLGLR